MKKSTKNVLLEHSRAKVELLDKYLRRYLNILARVPYVNAIYIFDLMCGEGVYEDGAKGSPVAILEAARDHYYANKSICKNIHVCINDNGMSDIDDGVTKVDRALRFCEQIQLPYRVKLCASELDVEDAIIESLSKIAGKERAKALFFVDPHGYKNIRIEHIKSVLQSGISELLLFLPISFMYRFASASMTKEFDGSEPLKNFLLSLYSEAVPKFYSANHFVEKIKEQFFQVLNPGTVWVDAFTIERDKSNLYSLFFFSTHELGYEKMLGVKWEMDSERGRGFHIQSDQGELFSATQASGLETKLRQFLAEKSKGRTNVEVRRFMLLEGFLPKHFNEILRELSSTPKPQPL